MSGNAHCLFHNNSNLCFLSNNCKSPTMQCKWRNNYLCNCYCNYFSLSTRNVKKLSIPKIALEFID